MNYQKIILIGNAASDAQPRKSKKGDVTFTTFDVAVSDAKNKACFFPVMVFGRQGEVTADRVKKGTQVLVEGRVEISNGFVDVIADRVVLGAPPQDKLPFDRDSREDRKEPEDRGPHRNYDDRDNRKDDRQRE